jgi:hypothetical protein
MFSKKSDAVFNLTFAEAFTKLFATNGSGGFIQGENFANGLYLDATNGTVHMAQVKVKNNTYDGIELFGTYSITKSQFNSKFRVFDVAHLAYIKD